MLELRYLEKQDGTRILQYRSATYEEGIELASPWKEPTIETEDAPSYDRVLFSKSLGYITSIQHGLGGTQISYTNDESYAQGYKTEDEVRLVMEKNNLSLWDYEIEKREG